MGVGLPSGTVTFLFTDIEGSTALWEAAPDAMRGALERHDAILHSEIEAHEGAVFSTGGDGVAAALADTSTAQKILEGRSRSGVRGRRRRSRTGCLRRGTRGARCRQ